MYRAWHWRKNWLPKGHRRFWFRLALFSLLGHLGLLVFTFGYRGKEHIELTVFSKIRPVEVVFVPLYKNIPNVQKQLKVAANLNQPKVKPKKVLAQAKTIVKNLPKPVSSHSSKPDSRVLKPIVEQPVLKKIVTKKNEAKPKVDPKKTKLKLKEQAVVMKTPEPPVEAAPVAVSKVDSVIEKAVPSEPIYIGRNDLKSLQMAHELEAVISKSWQPPVGFDADTECTVELVVDNFGKVVNFIMKKSSNIVVYDMSVRRIFAQVVMPLSVHNKTLTIVFRQ